MNPKPPRVRPLLLVLLWAWAACLALVLDLFWNVAEFDGIRPRAPLYAGMRLAAHAMVGEPIPDAGPATAPAPRPRRTPALRAEAPALDPLRAARPGSRHPGGRPSATTPQGHKLKSDLVAAAGSAEDPAQRTAAVRSLAAMFGTDSHDALSGIAEDPDQLGEVKDLASSLLRQGALVHAR